MDVKQLIGHNIRCWREFKEMKQADFAKKLNISKAAISNIENGKADITICRLYEITQLLKIEISNIFLSPQQTFDKLNSSKNSNESASYFNQIEIKDKQIEQLFALLKKQ